MIYKTMQQLYVLKLRHHGNNFFQVDNNQKPNLTIILNLE